MRRAIVSMALAVGMMRSGLVSEPPRAKPIEQVAIDKEAARRKRVVEDDRRRRARTRKPLFASLNNRQKAAQSRRALRQAKRLRGVAAGGYGVAA